MGDEIERNYQRLLAEYETFKARGLKLDLTRGKPATQQLDLSDELGGILGGCYILPDGTDVRNYGCIRGIPEARVLGGEIMGIPADNVLVGGNSSLTLMYQYLAFLLPRWRADAATEVKFICLVPGYDRHFTICEHFGIDMIPVPFLPDGPDTDKIAELASSDPSIKGIWCVPRYSNPSGHTYAPQVVQALARLPRSAGRGFTIFWDNAYAVHHIEDNPQPLADLLSEAQQAGTEAGIAMFASTSKITLAGAGISFFGASTKNLAAFEAWLGKQLIGFDKVNQLRHVRFLKDAAGIKAHMRKHRGILEPKFDLVQAKLDKALGGKKIAEWTRPKGGYFVSLNTRPGLASRVVELAGALGVKLTPAGATFPYGDDPEDRNIRLAPSFPPLEELETAMSVLVNCIELATLEQARSR